MSGTWGLALHVEAGEVSILSLQCRGAYIEEYGGGVVAAAAGRLCGCPAGRRGEDVEVFFPSLFNKGMVRVVGCPSFSSLSVPVLQAAPPFLPTSSSAS